MGRQWCLRIPKKWGFFANELSGFIAVQCLSFGIQCDGGPVCVDGQFKDSDESGE